MPCTRVTGRRVDEPSGRWTSRYRQQVTRNRKQEHKETWEQKQEDKGRGELRVTDCDMIKIVIRKCQSFTVGVHTFWTGTVDFWRLWEISGEIFKVQEAKGTHAKILQTVWDQTDSLSFRTIWPLVVEITAADGCSDPDFIPPKYFSAWRWSCF